MPAVQGHTGRDQGSDVRQEISYLSSPAPVSMGDSWFDVAHMEHFWIKRRFTVFRRLIKPHKATLASAAIGEIGCGSGLVQEQMHRSFGRRIDGFDLNEHALARPVNPANPRFLYDIHERHRELKDKYDVLILFDVIEHIDEESRFIDSVLYHLKPGGLLAVNVPALQWLYSSYDQAAGHVRRYSLRTLRKAFEARGTRVVAESYWGLPYVPLLLVRKLLLGRNNVDDSTIRKGFAPRGGIGNAVLGAAGACEWLPQGFLGTSAMTLFRKS